MLPEVLSFKPNNEERIYLEDNKINWTEYSHRNLEKDIRNHKFIRFDKFQMPFTMILIGLLVLLISVSNLLDVNKYIIVFCYSVSAFAVSFGIFSIVGVLKNG